MSVHPHGGGEHPCKGARPTRTGGSSPRGWGAHQPRGCTGSSRRFIPTGVGSTASAPEPRKIGAVHPHGGGEHSKSRIVSPLSSGSSPRGWGALPHLPQPILPPRFIPTGVGSTSFAVCESFFCAVHPHGGGEHDPPDQQDRRGLRFIPTGVGSTSIANRNILHHPVHPHGGGEHRTRRTRTPRSCGSSPRGWGALQRQGEAPRANRFIPTGVGSTWRTRARRPWSPVHPHGGGEHIVGVAVAGYFAGSSPRGWGARSTTILNCGTFRFIPTGVGSTLRSQG